MSLPGIEMRMYRLGGWMSGLRTGAIKVGYVSKVDDVGEIKTREIKVGTIGISLKTGRIIGDNLSLDNLVEEVPEVAEF